ncbi:MAG TPA: dihydrofolate reductase family protein [Steroidobacteraceae bacterium]|nr:dihydrofolate reductase family protein [Steroidobacteraceae bacterium]
MPDAEFPRPVQEYLQLHFALPPPERPHVILNMVASADGKAAVEGTESPLSSPVDKLVLQTLRVHADAILNGAGTARSSGANPRIREPRLRAARERMGRGDSPLQAVLSGRGDLPLDAPFLTRTDFRVVVFVGSRAGAAAVERLRTAGRPIEVLPGGGAALPELLRRLRHGYGVNLLLLEGGPSLNAGFFHQGLVDEFFLTISAHIVGGKETITPVEGEPFDAPGMPALDLISALPNPETNEVYLHWRTRPS